MRFLAILPLPFFVQLALIAPLSAEADNIQRGLAPTQLSVTTNFGTATGLGYNIAANPWIFNSTVNSIAADNIQGALVVGKTVTYIGNATGSPPAIAGYTRVNNGVTSNEAGINGTVDNYNTQGSQPTGTASAVGVNGIGVCEVAGCSATWGALAAGYDLSGQSDPPNPIYGLEVDNYGHGTDGHNVKIGIQIAAGRPDKTGAANQVGHGIMFTGIPPDGSFSNIIDGNGVAINGLNLNGFTFSGSAILSPGFVVDASGNTTVRTLKVKKSTVATLPTCNAAAEGSMAGVTDATAVRPYAAVAGGGTNHIPVYCNGSAWIAR
jgi:hypothetical protein